MPAAGRLRVQPEYDGIIAAHHPTPDELAAAQAVLAAVEEDLLYARVDLIRAPGGRLLLMELEAIEPDLYLEHDPQSGSGFAEAMTKILGPA